MERNLASREPWKLIPCARKAGRGSCAGAPLGPVAAAEWLHGGAKAGAEAQRILAGSWSETSNSADQDESVNSLRVCGLHCSGIGRNGPRLY